MVGFGPYLAAIEAYRASHGLDPQDAYVGFAPEDVLVLAPAPWGHLTTEINLIGYDYSTQCDRGNLLRQVVCFLLVVLFRVCCVWVIDLPMQNAPSQLVEFRKHGIKSASILLI